MRIQLTRFFSVKDVGTYGCLDIIGPSKSPIKHKQIFTIEREWNNNISSESCVPEGNYEMIAHPHNDRLIRLVSRENDVHMNATDKAFIDSKANAGNPRWGINIESANIPSQLQGCIALGDEIRSISFLGHKMQLGVLNSRSTLAWVMKLLEGEDLSKIPFLIKSI